MEDYTVAGDSDVSFFEVLHYDCQSFVLSSFGSLLEIFLGIGFGFFVLSRVNVIINSVLSVENQKSFKLIDSIDSLLELADGGGNGTKVKLKRKQIRKITSAKARLTQIKDLIIEAKAKIVISARYYFLCTGIYCFFLLLLSVFEVLLFNIDCQIVPSIVIVYATISLGYLIAKTVAANNFGVTDTSTAMREIIVMLSSFGISLTVGFLWPFCCNFGVTALLIILVCLSPFLALYINMRTYKSYLVNIPPTFSNNFDTEILDQEVILQANVPNY